jgi:hypothetical protein
MARKFLSIARTNLKRWLTQKSLAILGYLWGKILDDPVDDRPR